MMSLWRFLLAEFMVCAVGGENVRRWLYLLSGLSGREVLLLKWTLGYFRLCVVDG